MSDPQLPLAGLKVLDVGTFIFAPAVATVMADFGAEVVKVESPAGGDPYRYLHLVPPMPTSPLPYCWILTARNKRSITLDLRIPEGREVLYRLIREADVLVTNLHPSVLTKLQMTWEDVAPLNPRLVYAHATGYGENGNEVEKPGYDATAWWARSGLMDALRSDGAEPSGSAPGMGDHPSAMSLFGGVMMALYRRERTGRGGKVSSSLMANGVWSNACFIQSALCGAEAYQRMPRAESPNALVNLYQTADDRWIFLALVQEVKDWERFARAIGREELLDDERFDTLAARHENGPALFHILEADFRSRSLEEWRRILDENDLTFGVVALTSEAPDDAQMVGHGLFPPIGEVADGDDPLRTVTSPIWLEGCTKRPAGEAPELGEHTHDVLVELGYEPGEIETLRQSGALGDVGGGPED